GKHRVDAASTAHVEHPVILAAIVDAGLLVLKRLVDGGENREGFAVQGNGRPPHIQLPNVPVPEGHKSAFEKGPRVHRMLLRIFDIPQSAKFTARKLRKRVPRLVSEMST